MANTRVVSAALTVPEFLPSGDAGTYTFTGASFNNQTDTSGDGAFSVQVGFRLYVPAMDAATSQLIPGTLHRYKLTAVTNEGVASLGGTMVWDEPGTPYDLPANGSTSLLCEVSAVHQLGLPPVDSIYADLPPGAAVSALVLDARFILDNLGSGGSAGTEITHTVPVTTNKQTVFTLLHAPLPSQALVMIVNGVQYSDGFTVSGTTLTWTSTDFDLETSDTVMVSYYY